MSTQFITEHSSILAKLAAINPIKYAKTRNFIDGDVTYLSPYISRGVISTKDVLEKVLEQGHSIFHLETFIKELCWRDYFQRVGQVKNLQQDIKQAQPIISNHGIPNAVIESNTGIEGIDQAIEQLYQTGYMHNHCRMYTASMVCNVAKSHWAEPATWMYYHLLDGDFASNTCSWQWVAGANSNKLYFANQENINKYTFTNQRNTFLDCTYEELEQVAIPTNLLSTSIFNNTTLLPEANAIQFNPIQPIFIYNYYNLDPLWHQQESGNRILLLDPAHFERYPISKNCVDFMLGLSKNIPNIQIHIGSFESLIALQQDQRQPIYFKEHPLNVGYKGIEEPRDWIAPTVSGYFPSFFSYWKQAEKAIKKIYT